MAAQSPTFNLGFDEVATPGTARAAFAEMLATGLFVFIGVGSIAAFVTTAGPNSALVDGLPVIALTHGITIGLLAAGIAAISGGHINPAVTFAFMLTGRISLGKGFVYMVAQLVGACLGMLLLRAFVLDEVILAIPGAGGHAINETYVTSKLAALGLEATGTFILVWTIFGTAVSRRGSGVAAPLYIGLAVAAMHFVLIPLTGCGINPARTFGPLLVNNRWGETPGWWVYFIGPLIGAALAGMTYYILYLSAEELEPEEPLG
jgi:MIP family channel proteins